MNFGLACEGFTDHATITNILYGYYPNLKSRNITELQPAFDATDGRQYQGGWQILLKYLTLENFREAVVNIEYVILQIDTDASNGFDVPHVDDNGNELSTDTLVVNVVDKLIAKINEGQSGFYTEHAKKIIFAISVHSIECWLVDYYAQQAAIDDCFGVLKKLNNLPVRVSKKYHNYNELSRKAFSSRTEINSVAQKSPSFNLFIQQLPYT
jgi:hypothetical protein